MLTKEGMNRMNDGFFIEPEELAKKLGEADLRLVDASWYLPAMNRDGKAEYQAARIPGAVHFDINAIADTSRDLPHMLPLPAVFAEETGKLGITETDEIVVYDGPGVFSSARVWWTFKIMGALNVRILAGGMDRWKTLDLPIETGKPKPASKVHFQHHLKADSVRDFSYMLNNIRRGETLVLDARPFGRFTGEVPEPREGLRGGHIPASRPLPAMDIVRNGTLLGPEELCAAFVAAGVTPERHVTTTCGSGVTAAILSLGLEMIGHKSHSLYDGSWAEWGAMDNAPVAAWK